MRNLPQKMNNTTKKIKDQIQSSFSKNIDDILIKKYKTQYKNITFINNNPFHDRYIILDKKNIYVSGLSLKDIGKKYSYINKENESIFKFELLKRIKNIVK